MIALDNRTILFVQIFLAVIATFFSFFPSRKSRKLIMHTFRAANVFYLLGFGFLWFQNILPSFLTIIAANLFIILSFSLYSANSMIIFGKKVFWTPLIVLLVFHTLGFLFFTYLMPNTLMRILLISLEVILVFGWALIKHKRPDHSRRIVLLRAVQLIFAGYILVSLFRIVITLMLNNNIDSIFSLDGATSLIFMATTSFHVTMNLVFIINLILQYDDESRQRISLLEQTHHDISELNSLSIQMLTPEGIQELYEGITRFMINYFGASAVGIYLRDIDGDQVQLKYISGFPEKMKSIIASLPVNETTVTGRAILRREPVIEEMKDYPDSPLKKTLTDIGYVALASYPIHTARGALGSFTMTYREVTDRMYDESPFFHLLCHQIGTILENAYLYKSLNIKATTDPLTGIYNRRELLHRLDQEYARSRRKERPFSLLMMDIDHFKHINDTYGHDMGDIVLKEIVRAVQAELRQEDDFGRYGGEEFLLILTETDLNTAAEIAERIRLRVESTGIRLDRETVSVTISIGGTMIIPQDPDGSSLITRADGFLYEAKESGRNRSILR